MKVLHFLRICKKHWKQLFLIVIMAAISLGVLIGIKSTSLTLENTKSNFFTNYTYEQRVGIKPILERADNSNNYRQSLESTIDSKVLKVNVTSDINRFAMPIKESETLMGGVALDYLYAQNNNLEKGDTLQLSYQNRNYTFQIDNLVYAPEYTNILMQNSQILPDHINQGYIYIDETVWKKAVGVIHYNEVVVSTDQDKATLENNEKVEILYSVDFQNDVAYQTIEAKNTQILSIAEVFPFLLFFLTAIISFSTIKRIISEYASDIAILSAYGVSSRYWISVFSWFTSLILMISIGLGSTLGLLIPRILMRTFSIIFAFPKFYYQYSIAYFLIGVVLLILILIGTAVYTIKQLHTSFTISTLKGEDNVIIKGQYLKIFNRNAVIPFYIKMFLREIINHKWRYFISIFGVALAGGLTISALGLNDTMANLSEEAFTQNSTYFAKNYYDNSNQLSLEGNEELFFESKTIIHAEHNQFMTTVVGIKSTSKYIHLRDENNRLQELPEEGVLISRKIQESYGLNIGDEIELQLPRGKASFEIKGVVKTPVGQNVYLNVDELKGVVNGVFSDEEIKNKDIPVRQSINRDDEINEFNIMMKSMQSIVVLIVVSSMSVLIAVLINFCFLVFNEKYNTIGTLRLIGISKYKSFAVLIFEVVIVTVLGIAISWPLGFKLHRIIFSKGFGNHLDVTLYLSEKSVLITFLLIVIVTIGSLLLVLRKDKKINFVAVSKNL